jgi:NADH-quinone oxidoreductase subunit G
VLKPGSTVIVWGGEAHNAVVDAASKLDAKLLEVPDGANGRGLREVGCLPDAGPGLSEAPMGRNAAEIRDGLADGILEAAFLVNADPVRDFPGGPEWSEALGKAKFVLAISMFENASTKHADVVFPAEFYAEKEGTVTHPDGRLQRLRPGVPRPDGVRPIWQVLVELSALLGDETGIDSPPEALAAIASEVPFYAGITHEEIGGRGVRWQHREAASAFPSGDGAGARDEVPVHAAEPAVRSAPEPAGNVAEGEASGGVVRLGTYRDLWASEVADQSPALRFLAPRQTLELAPADADRLAVAQGDEVEVRSNGSSLRARVMIRERMRPGSGFLIEGTAEANANALPTGELVEVTKAGGEA